MAHKSYVFTLAWCKGMSIGIYIQCLDNDSAMFHAVIKAMYWFARILCVICKGQVKINYRI